MMVQNISKCVIVSLIVLINIGCNGNENYEKFIPQLQDASGSWLNEIQHPELLENKEFVKKFIEILKIGKIDYRMINGEIYINKNYIKGFNIYENANWTYKVLKVIE